MVVDRNKSQTIGAMFTGWYASNSPYWLTTRIFYHKSDSDLNVRRIPYSGILSGLKDRDYSMRAMLKILWSGLVNAYDAAFSIVLSNIFFIVLSIPVITLPLAVAGVYYTNYQIASGESVDWKTFFVGIKRCWWAGIRWTVVNGVVIFSLIFYFFFFLTRVEFWATALVGLILGILAFWVLIQFLLFPMMLIQEKQAYLLALRNTMIFIMHWPGFSFTFLFSIIVLVVASMFFPPLWIFLSIGLVAYLGSYAVYYRIESDRHPELFSDPRRE